MLKIDALYKDRGMKIINGSMEAWLNFHEKPEKDTGSFYAGAITSLLLDNKEFLDPANANYPDMFMFHDREKRCMQIDKVQLHDRNGRKNNPFFLFNKSYEYIGHEIFSKKKLNITFLSCNILYDGKKLRLKRELSLPYGSRYIVEDISLIDDKGFVQKKNNFTIGYYNHIHTRLSSLQSCFSPDFPDGFMMYYDCSYPAVIYGFTSDAILEKKPKEQHNSFSWEISGGPCIRCVHFFMKSNSIMFNINDILKEISSVREYYFGR